MPKAGPAGTTTSRREPLVTGGLKYAIKIGPGSVSLSTNAGMAVDEKSKLEPGSGSSEALVVPSAYQLSIITEGGVALSEWSKMDAREPAFDMLHPQSCHCSSAFICHPVWPHADKNCTHTTVDAVPFHTLAPWTAAAAPHRMHLHPPNQLTTPQSVLMAGAAPWPPPIPLPPAAPLAPREPMVLALAWPRPAFLAGMQDQTSSRAARPRPLATPAPLPESPAPTARAVVGVAEVEGGRNRKGRPKDERLYKANRVSASQYYCGREQTSWAAGVLAG
jgi:hypothetical protein